MHRLLLLLPVAIAATLPASAQDWAKAKLDQSPRHQEWVKVKSGSREVTCFVVYPEVKDKAPAVLLIHEIFGLSDWARSEADAVAAAGYVAIFPDLLSGMAPGGGGTSEFPDQSAVIKAVGMLPPEQVTADLNAVADYIEKVPACNGHLVVGGFCWGGGQSFRFATNRQDLKAAFVFYGVAPAATDVPRINCPVYGFYAGNDARISSTVPATADLMKKDGKTYESRIYDGAGHGFMRAGDAPMSAAPATDADDAAKKKYQGDVANKKARDEAWSRWMELMKKV